MPTINLCLEKLIGEALAQRGYAHLDGKFFGAHDPDLKEACSAFVESCRDLPNDEHSSDGSRKRRYGTFVLLPWNWRLEPVPPVWDSEKAQLVSRYMQSAHLNPEHGGRSRTFAPLTEEQIKNPFLQNAILASFLSIKGKLPSQPIAVGCHLIEHVAKPGSPAASSPDLIHQDGEPYTFAALIERRGVRGGPVFRNRMAAWLRWILGWITPPISPRLLLA